jgi:ParB/RepB/Spo0J family partition protein
MATITPRQTTMTVIRDIPVADLKPPAHLLRNVNTKALDYMEMYYSVQDYGFLNSISVRASAEPPYEVLDGMWRFTIAQALRLETIPCIVKEVPDDTDALLMQIQANSIGPETTPCEFAEHLDRILKMDANMTLVTLAGRLRKDVRWIRETLNLNRLPTRIKKSIDRGEMPVKSAKLLAKLPPSLQESFYGQAKMLRYEDFSPIARKTIKDWKEATRQGSMKNFYKTQYTPHPYLRTMKDLLRELHTSSEGAVYLSIEKLTPLEAWTRGVEWTMHMDPKGIEEQTKRYSGMRKQTQTEVQTRKADREAIKKLEESGNNDGSDLTNDKK